MTLPSSTSPRTDPVTTVAGPCGGGRRRPWVAAVATHRMSALALLGLLAIWEIIGRLPSSDGVFPAPTAIAAQAWRDRDLLLSNASLTLENAALGFVYGNAAAVLLAVLFNLVPVLGRLSRGLLVTIYCLPLIVLAPIIGVSFGGDTPKVVLASLAVVFPTYISTTIGLRSAQGIQQDVVRGMGGNRWTVLRKVQLRACVPDLLAGMRVAAPAAVLGAMLGEFLGGSKGLGVLLVATMPQAFPERLWAVGLFATAIAAACYGVLALIGRLVAARQQDPTVGVGAVPADERVGGLPEPVWSALSVLVVLGAWIGYLWATDLPPTFAKGPDDVWRYLVDGPKAADHREMFLDALAVTLPRTALGLVCGLALAFGLAVVLSMSRALSSALLPVALVSQSMPLVALTPLLVIVLGRGDLTVLAITTSVTFFPSFVTVAQGLRATPRAATEVLDVYAASRWTVLWKVAAPGAIPHLVESARLAIPRALLGVILAEYLALGTGVGELILQARGKLEFSLLWSVAAVVTLLSVLAYSAVGLVERFTRRRFGA
ncbi:ABC transporter permease [Nakamurella alba]|uniref:ABC transporter permease n=1 Tax=Nakamurella alba TaxID=2665158 RepID=UPI0018AB6947|nr:ABC transporter permease subunit [Nakamurella alba]